MSSAVVPPPGRVESDERGLLEGASPRSVECGGNPPPAPADSDDDPPAPSAAATLSELMTRRGPGLRAYALSLLSGRSDAAGGADDVVQGAFTRLARRLAADPEPPPDPVGWLFSTVRNLCKDRGRSAARRSRRERIAAVAGWFAPDRAAADPAEATQRKLDAAAAEAALADLPESLREAVTLHLWGERSFAQIGELTGVSRSAAHRNYSRGLDLLRRRLGERS